MKQNKSTLTKLQSTWYKRLKDDGFNDIEDEKGRLKNSVIRISNVSNKYKTLKYYTAIELILLNCHIPEIEREILEQYTTGQFITDIAKRINRSRRYVTYIVSFYKEIVIEVYGHF
jgi:hypothetical protein